MRSELWSRDRDVIAGRSEELGRRFAAGRSGEYRVGRRGGCEGGTGQVSEEGGEGGV